MASSLVESYEALPYSNQCFHHTHPDLLATLATLAGMSPAPPNRCRVLELGCARGGNLIPMAFSLPESRFLGIDLAPGHIASGQKAVDALELTNIELKTLSIMDVDERLGDFDYIIGHGVYSWVAEDVQDKILAICRDRLKPGGVVYLSYNVYPGWHVGGMIRDAIAFHDQPAQAIPERVARARELLKVLGDGARAAGSGHAEILEKEIGRLTLLPDSYFLHEYMEEDNHPVYFRDFMARAAGTGLQFLAEARVRIMSFAKPAHVGDGSLPLPADLLDREELFDFIHARTFRRTLLCHDEVRLCRDPGPHSIGEMLIGGHAQPVASANDSPSSAVEEFREMGTESTLRTENPLVKAVLHALHDVGPRAVSLATLSRAIGARGSHSLASAAASREPDPARLAEAVWACFLGSLVELYTHVPRFVVEVSERPIASPVARFQAAQGETRLASLRHRDVELTPLPRLILMHLDGTRDRSALLALLEERLAQGELTFRQPGPTPPDPIQIRLHLAEMLENSLRALAKKAFLIA